MSRLFALKPLDADQAAAAHPFIHASLSASAGTGKTQVLTARVLRLLLEDASPESILCLTFTKAAAAEMAERVGGRLAYWVGLDDAALSEELQALGVVSDSAMRIRARRLFATVLDCPGGLRIQTIHSFCQALLAAFPAEAGITPGFRPIEGREEEALVERTRRAMAPFCWTSKPSPRASARATCASISSAAPDRSRAWRGSTGWKMSNRTFAN